MVRVCVLGLGGDVGAERRELFWFGIVNRGGGIRASPFYRIDSAAGWPPVRSMRVSISSRNRPYGFACVQNNGAGRGARFFSEDERVLIGDLLRAGQSVRSIAVRLGRSPSTISREVRRNSSEAGNYRPFTAHRMALARRPRPRPGRLAHDKPLRDFVQGKLKLRWSPEQICHALPIEFPGQRERHLVHETIYQALTCRER